MPTTPVLRPAQTYADLNATLHMFDCKRYRDLATILRECGRPNAAFLAERYGQEHEDAARRIAPERFKAEEGES